MHLKKKNSPAQQLSWRPHRPSSVWNVRGWFPRELQAVGVKSACTCRPPPAPLLPTAQTQSIQRQLRGDVVVVSAQRATPCCFGSFSPKPGANADAQKGSRLPRIHPRQRRPNGVCFVRSLPGKRSVNVAEGISHSGGLQLSVQPRRSFRPLCRRFWCLIDV